MVRAAAIFLLINPPLTELPEDIATLVQNFRNKILTKKQALDLMMDHHYLYLEEYVNQNLLLNEIS